MQGRAWSLKLLGHPQGCVWITCCCSVRERVAWGARVGGHQKANRACLEVCVRSMPRITPLPPAPQTPAHRGSNVQAAFPYPCARRHGMFASSKNTAGGERLHNNGMCFFLFGVKGPMFALCGQSCLWSVSAVLWTVCPLLGRLGSNSEDNSYVEI